MRSLLTAGVCLLCIRLATAELLATVYPNTAFADAPTLNGTVPLLDSVLPNLNPWQSIVFQGQVTEPGWHLFSVDVDEGHVRLWVDDHLIVNGGPAVPPPPACSYPGGDPTALPGYLQWLAAQMPLAGADDPRSMAAEGGECTHGCSASVCEALCEKLAGRFSFNGQFALVGCNSLPCLAAAPPLPSLSLFLSLAGDTNAAHGHGMHAGRQGVHWIRHAQAPMELLLHAKAGQQQCQLEESS